MLQLHTEPKNRSWKASKTGQWYNFITEGKDLGNHRRHWRKHWNCLPNHWWNLQACDWAVWIKLWVNFKENSWYWDFRSWNEKNWFWWCSWITVLHKWHFERVDRTKLQGRPTKVHDNPTEFVETVFERIAATASTKEPVQQKRKPLKCRSAKQYQ